MSITLIICISIVLYAVAIGGMWHNLGGLDKTRKIILIIVQILLVYIITLIVFSLSKGNVNYPNEMLEKATGKVLILIFTGVNVLIIPPLISKRISKLHEGEMSKEMFIKQTIMILIIFIICLLFESGYMKSTQEGIIKIYQKNS